MPALKPLPSLARVEANRANAQRSTGPRTPEGKARSRGNAVVHGLTGQGIALPGEDEAQVEGRFAALRAELGPSTALGAHLVGRIALMTVRAQRAALQEARALAHRVRHAAEDFDRDRRREARALIERLDADPRATRRDLLRTPEGVDLLRDALLDLRADLNRPDPAWSAGREAHLEACHGRRVGDRVVGRTPALSVALRSGELGPLAPADRAAALRAPDPRAWAAAELIAEIDAERARLDAHRGTLDHAAIALDRAEAADRALFDPGRAATLARRYEAAATRELFRSLAALREAEAEAAACPPAEPAEPAPPAPPAIVPVAVGPPAPEPSAPPAQPIEKSATFAPKLLVSPRLAASMASFGLSPFGVEPPGVPAGLDNVLPIFAGSGGGPKGPVAPR